MYYVYQNMLLISDLIISDARIDIRNNENKLALEMATNAQCASLLKRKLGGSEYNGALEQQYITQQI